MNILYVIMIFMNEKPVGSKVMQRIRVLRKNEFGFLKI